ncbi:hypothetical protein [Baaleninema simplex]|uniref:hypothetical protein n=1 Tax=Baaleninema simplex TaxID=2862350 RepID=UPI00034B9E0E|nr:hypothetical protein [Baaleninema simplex]
MKAIEEQPNPTSEPLQVLDKKIHTQLDIITGIISVFAVVIVLAYAAKLMGKRFWE